MAHVNGSPAGMISAHLHKREVEYTSLWMAPFVRRHGLGDRLVDTVIQWARDQKAGPVILSVKDHNASAIRLYRRQGFHEVEPCPQSDPGSSDQTTSL